MDVLAEIPGRRELYMQDLMNTGAARFDPKGLPCQMLPAWKDIGVAAGWEAAGFSCHKQPTPNEVGKVILEQWACALTAS